MLDIYSLFSEIYEYVKTKKEYFDIFIDLDTRYEGWLEAEILKYISNNLPELSIISTKKKFEGYGQPDIVLEFQEKKWIIELKAFLINRRSLKFYLLDKGKKVGVQKEFQRVSKLNSNFWIIICFAPCLGSKDKNYVNVINQVLKTYDIKKLNELIFLTPKNNPITLTLWGK